MSRAERILHAILYAILAGGSAAAFYQVSQAISEQRAAARRAGPDIQAAAHHLAALTAALSDCHQHAGSCLEVTAGRIQTAAGSIQDAAADLAEMSQKANAAADSAAAGISQAADQLPAAAADLAAAAGNLRAMSSATGEAAAMLTDCHAYPRTCIPPRIAGALRALELSAGDTHIVTREAAAVAKPTAAAIQETAEHSAGITATVDQVAAKTAPDVVAIVHDAHTITHRIASPFTYVLGLLHAGFKKVFPWLP